MGSLTHSRTYAHFSGILRAISAVTFNVNGNVMFLSFVVLGHCAYDAILGFGVLKDIPAKIDCGTGEFQFVPPSFFDSDREESADDIKLCAHENTFLLPRTGKWAMAAINNEMLNADGSVDFNKVMFLEHGPMSPSSLIFLRNGKNCSLAYQSYD